VSTHKNAFLQHTNALLQVFPMLYAAALDQPNPTEELKVALVVGQRWAEQLKSQEKLELVADKIGRNVDKLADDILKVPRGRKLTLAEELMKID